MGFASIRQGTKTTIVSKDYKGISTNEIFRHIQGLKKWGDAGMRSPRDAEDSLETRGRILM